MEQPADISIILLPAPPPARTVQPMEQVFTHLRKAAEQDKIPLETAAVILADAFCEAVAGHAGVSTDNVYVGFDLDNETITLQATDQNGTAREYSPDQLGRRGFAVISEQFAYGIEQHRKQLTTEWAEQHTGQLITGIVVARSGRRAVVNLLNGLEGLEGVINSPFRLNTVLARVTGRIDPTSSTRLELERSSTDFVKALFTHHVQAVQNGQVDVTRVVRKPGVMSLVEVTTEQPHTDPVAVCVGAHGVRLRQVVSELERERVVLVEAGEPELFLQSLLRPAEIKEWAYNHDNTELLAKVHTDRPVGLVTGNNNMKIELGSELLGSKLTVQFV